jgi:microcystin-dependent protein
MPYPPPVPPNTRTNSTPQADNHPLDHNQISVALTELLNHIAALEARIDPLGTIQFFAGDTPPVNWSFCRGGVASRATYPGLFAVIGLRFNPAHSDPLTFPMPDFRGRYPFGHNAGGTYGEVGVGQKFGFKDTVLVAHEHDLNGTATAVPGHTHDTGTEPVVTHNQAAGSIYLRQEKVNPMRVNAILDDTASAGGHSHPVTGKALTEGVSGVSQNLPPALSVNFIIRML